MTTTTHSTAANPAPYQRPGPGHTWSPERIRGLSDAEVVSYLEALRNALPDVDAAHGAMIAPRVRDVPARGGLGARATIRRTGPDYLAAALSDWMEEAHALLGFVRAEASRRGLDVS